MSAAGVLLWSLGTPFIVLSPFVTHERGQKAARWFQLGFAVVGALCWRFA